MQHQYQIVHASVHACIAGLLYLFLRHVAIIDRPEFVAYADYLRGGAILILPFLFNQSGAISTIIIERIPVFSRSLRRVLSGSNFIEGDWPLVVVDAETRSVRYYGFMTIKYERGQIEVAGDDWLPDGRHAIRFRSQQSSLENRKLQYWYAQGATLHSPSMFGYTRIYFFPEIGRVERLAGEFLDKEHTSPPFFAKRIRYRGFARKLTTPEQKQDAAKQLWNEIKDDLAATPNLPIERDFART